jgi:mannose-1-phosphate guanylyltransferase
MKEDYIILSSTLKRYGNDVGKLIAAYSIVSGLSIDYALIEKARNIHCIRAMFSWNDLGGWKALAEYNRCRNIRQEDGMNNWIYSDNEDLEILTVGVSDMLLVKYKNKLIIVPKDKINQLKLLANV